MTPLVIAKITSEPHPRHDYRTQWVISFSYPSHEDDVFLVYRTGNTDEAMATPKDFGEFLGYSTDVIEIRHLY